MDDIIDLGKEMFAKADESVISWKGHNYYKACDALVREFQGGTTHCVKMEGHKSIMHEDFEGIQGYRHEGEPPRYDSRGHLR